MIRKEMIITNKLGLHARAAAKLVQKASTYASEIYLIHKDKKVNGKSIMGLMMLAASKGTNIEIIASGEDESLAMQDLEKLIQDKFGEAE